MAQQSFTVERGARVVVIGCEGELTVTGRDEATVVLDSDSEVTARREGNTITIEAARVPLQLQAPVDTAIEVQRHQGSVQIVGVGDVQVERAGSVALRNISGDVRVRDVEALRLESEPHFRPRRDEQYRSKGSVT